ncbi:MAG: hypothetical protein PHU88_00290, partial [candidate division Zixibacteria bacterium]|nr:hypothetical protein [candidate division Zixibacteria bacterium]
EIYNAVHRLIKEALRQESVVPVFLPRGIGPEQTEKKNNSHQERFPGYGKGKIIPGPMSRFKVNKDFLRELYHPSGVEDTSLDSNIVRVDKTTGEIVENQATVSFPGKPGASLDRLPELPRVIQKMPAAEPEEISLTGKFADLYLLCKTGDKLYIIDQHAAHERILYEDMLRRLDNHAVVAQQLLFPVPVELSPEQLACFEEFMDLINRSGFTVSAFGGRMVNIEAVPTILGRKDPEIIIRQILDDLAALKKAGQDIKKAMAQSLACRAAVMAGDRLSDEEALGLVRQLMHCENPYSCPHGRPTFIKVSREDLDRQFGRC